MTNSDRVLLAVGILLACGFLLLMALVAPTALRLMGGRRPPTPDIIGTFQALVATGSPAAPSQTAVAGTLAASTPEGTSIPKPAAGGPGGHIVFTCQIYKYQSSEQICIMNSDGSDYHRLTTDDGYRHYYPSLSPDGKSVAYSQYREDNVYEIWELDIASGMAKQLTDRLGVLNSPEISPDGKSILFMRWTVASDEYQVWMMDRDGGNPRRVFKGVGWDPTWSPDGKEILFASDRDGLIELYVGNVDGSHVHKISNLPSVRGRSDWSVQNLIATYSGDAWSREVFVMNLDGSNVHRVSPKGGNSQGPSFSPDGQWIAYTAYYDHFNDINGCEIYITRLDGSGLNRLTNNDYCDYQPRWGP
jgi:TolB protein